MNYAEGEIWKDITGYEGLYQVSNHGRVKSLNYNHTGNESIMTGGLTTSGYRGVCLYKDGRQLTKKVHRLVAAAFIPNPCNLPSVNHIDECKTNNYVYNLEWCTARQNANHGTANKRRVIKQGRRVLQLNKQGLEVARFSGIREAERQTGITYQSIGRCCRGGRKKAGGFIWRYE